jgi:hypothetical protein
MSTVVDAAATFTERRQWIEEERQSTPLPVAALERFDYMVECLRTRHIRPGWSFDEAGAARTRRYLSSLVAGEPHNQLECNAAFDWLNDHGQPLGWILDGDPTGLICRCASYAPRRKKPAPLPAVVPFCELAAKRVPASPRA